MPITAPVCGEACVGVVGRGDAEVGDLHLALRRDEHVARLDVAVHDAVAVREGERVGDLGRDPGRVHRPGARPCARRMSRSDWPSTYSITMKDVPCSWPQS